MKKTGFYTDFDVHLGPHEMTLKKRNSVTPDPPTMYNIILLSKPKNNEKVKFLIFGVF